MEKSKIHESPKYSIDERVEASGWMTTAFGKIVEIKWIYHTRLDEWTWGYKIVWENKGPGLALVFVPEGYLKKVKKEVKNIEQKV